MHRLSRLAPLVLALAACGSPAPEADAGRADAGATLDAGGAVDGGSVDSGPGADDAGPADSCPCFGAAEIAAVEAHGVDHERGCQVAVATGNITTSALSSSDGPQVNQLDNVESVGFAGTDYRCAAGCSDTNDDTVDDCIGAPLPAYASRIIDEAQYAACEALLQQACR